MIEEQQEKQFSPRKTVMSNYKKQQINFKKNTKKIQRTKINSKNKKLKAKDKS
jgi:hypothetical protein